MDEYVQLPLTATALRKWLRFSEKGGIGRAVSLADKLAESGTDELMFMEGEPITVLMQLNDGRYLGSCEGVVGIFHETDVRFLTKLKKPVFTKKPTKPDIQLSKSQLSEFPRPQATPSPGPPHLYGSPATPHALSPAKTPTTLGERRAFSAPTSASALLSLQEDVQNFHAARGNPSLHFSTAELASISNGRQNADRDLNPESHPGVRYPASPVRLEARSPSALEDNDDIFSSYIYDRNGDSESLSTSTFAPTPKQAIDGRQIESKSTENCVNTFTTNELSQSQTSTNLRAPLNLHKLRTHQADIEHLKDKPKLSQRVEVPPKVTILPNLPAGVSLKQLRERTSPRFPLSPRSVSDRGPGKSPLTSGQGKHQASIPSSSEALGGVSDGTRYAGLCGASCAGQSHTPIASPVSNGFDFVDSPLLGPSPTSSACPEYQSMATTTSTMSSNPSNPASPHHQSRLDQHRDHNDWLDNQNTGLDGSSDTRSLSSFGSSSRGLSHSRSMSSLTRTGSNMFQRRPSLPIRADSNAGSVREEGVVELGNAQFQFVQPQVADYEGGSPHSTVDSLQTASTSRLVTRPSVNAKERVRSIYVFDAPADKAEENPVIDKFGFIHSQHTLITGNDTDIPSADDGAALQAYRDRESKVSSFAHLLARDTNACTSQWITIMSTMSPRNARSSGKVKKLVNYGIPNSVRGKAWVREPLLNKLLTGLKASQTFLAEAPAHQKGASYHDLCAKEEVSQCAEITKDMDICFHDHSHFSDEDSIGRQDLQCVLRALLHYLPDLVYERGLCYIAGMLLLHVEAESAFWLLVTTVVDYLPSYFGRGREGSLIDANILVYVLQHGEPDLYKHLENQPARLDQIFRSWLSSAFVRTLPWPSQLRVMDLFFFGDRPSQLGIRVGLALLDLLRDHLLARRQNAVQLLLSPPADLLSVSFFIPSLLTIKLPNRTLKKATKWAHGQRPSS